MERRCISCARLRQHQSLRVNPVLAVQAAVSPDGMPWDVCGSTLTDMFSVLPRIDPDEVINAAARFFSIDSLRAPINDALESLYQKRQQQLTWPLQTTPQLQKPVLPLLAQLAEEIVFVLRPDFSRSAHHSPAFCPGAQNYCDAAGPCAPEPTPHGLRGLSGDFKYDLSLPQPWVQFKDEEQDWFRLACRWIHKLPDVVLDDRACGEISIEM